MNGRMVARQQRQPDDADGVVVVDDGPVRVITIDRPARRNAVDSRAAAALLSAFESFDVDDSAFVAVLTGAGDASAPAPTSRPSPAAIDDRWATTVQDRWAPPGCG